MILFLKGWFSNQKINKSGMEKWLSGFNLSLNIYIFTYINSVSI